MSFEESGDNKTFVEGTLAGSGNGSTEPPRIASGLFEDWQSDAKIEAYHKLRSDLSEFSEPSPASSLRTYAAKTGAGRLRHFPGIDRRGKSINQLISMYTDTFVQCYGEHLREGRESGDIPDETTIAIQKKAHEDRVLSLSTAQLPIYGTIRTIEYLLKQTIPFEQLSRIEQLASSYQQAYSEEKGVERNSSDSSDPF